MMATSPSTSGQQPDAVLEQYVFGTDPRTGEAVPRQLAPKDVAEFVRNRIDTGSEVEPIRRTEKVVGFYDVHEVCGQFKGYLGRREVSEDDVLRSIAFVRTVARVGPPSDRQFARDYYLHLTRLARSTPALQEMAQFYEALGPEGDVQPLRGQIQGRLQQLEQKRDTDPEAKYDHQALSDLERLTLPRIEKANAEKAKLLQMTARRARIDAEIRMYLGIGYGYLEYLPFWAAGRLRREVWAEQPEQQVQRADDSARRNELARAFRDQFGRLGRVPGLHPEEKTHATVRCLRAIDFLGGTLTPEEKKYLNDHAGSQFDILSNE